jgi:hypothetical protein
MKRLLALFNRFRYRNEPMHISPAEFEEQQSCVRERLIEMGLLMGLLKEETNGNRNQAV